ncbi:nucleotidyltransferase family protein [Nostocoides sp. F2B08]|uniref:nucleotidyltransferase family protein n=1 Tax=Nostocoides sp. F2B08 TaxID=2653936 RepID=UPI001D03D8FA|nr:nucleotidyltransferase family protein [Tetrasphaera sp. F2B08]
MQVESTLALPRDVAVALSHAAVQAIADQERLTVLHIKGPIVDATLRASALARYGDDEPSETRRRHSIDADVLVAPSQARSLLDAMTRHGWTLAWDFDEGSLFAHAATMQHRYLAHVDVHRWFPGIEMEPELAFRTLTEGARRIDVAEYPCLVPSDDAHRLILLLHAARSGGGAGASDVTQLWTRSTSEQQEAVRRLAEDLDARVALAAAIDELDSVRHHRSYRLWRALQRPQHTHREVLVGHLRSARPRELLPLVIRFALLNKRRMQRQSEESLKLRETLHAYRVWVKRRMGVDS